MRCHPTAFRPRHEFFESRSRSPRTLMPASYQLSLCHILNLRLSFRHHSRLRQAWGPSPEPAPFIRPEASARGGGHTADRFSGLRCPLQVPCRCHHGCGVLPRRGLESLGPPRGLDSAPPQLLFPSPSDPVPCISDIFKGIWNGESFPEGFPSTWPRSVVTCGGYSLPYEVRFLHAKT